jgi:hypothetical protein
MGTIWFFGDSFTEGYNTDYQWVRDYIQHKGYTPKHFTKLLGKKYDCSIANFGFGGIDNNTILDNIINNLKYIKENDIISIQWTSINRFRLASKKYEVIYSTELLNTKRAHKDLDIDIECLTNIASNRQDNGLFINEIDNWSKLLKYTFREQKIVIWSPFPEYNKCNNIFNKGTWENEMTIDRETESLIQDHHYGEYGNKAISEILSNLI